MFTASGSQTDTEPPGMPTITAVKGTPPAVRKNGNIKNLTADPFSIPSLSAEVESTNLGINIATNGKSITIR